LGNGDPGELGALISEGWGDQLPLEAGSRILHHRTSIPGHHHHPAALFDP
jgi:hypothetical protein